MTDISRAYGECSGPGGLPPGSDHLTTSLSAPAWLEPESAAGHFALTPGIACQVGAGLSRASVLAEAVFLLTFACDQTGAIISVSAHASPPSRSNADVTISLTLEACQRWFGEKPLEGRWHMSRTLRAIVLAMAQAARRDATSLLYLRGKGLELVCETLSSLSANQLVPCSAGDVLSEADTTRIFRARTIIEDRHAEPLTLHMIALACGVNRSKLTKGFNALFGITVAEFICMTRMSSARELLLTTDLRITTISARCGYSNNASFSRAFLRHYGVSPMTLRARPL